MAGLERLLRGPLEQVAMIRTNGVEAAQALGVKVGERMWTALEEAPSVCERLAGGVSVVVAEKSVQELMRNWKEQRRGVDEVLVKMLWGQMQRMGWRGGEPGAWSEEEWKKTTGGVSKYERWVKESLRILIAHGDLEETGGIWSAKEG